MYMYHIYRKDSCTGKIAAGGIWASKSGKNPPAVAELLPDVGHKGQHQNSSVGLFPPPMLTDGYSI